MATIDFPQCNNNEKSTLTATIGNNNNICDSLEELVKLNNLHHHDDNNDENADDENFMIACTPTTTNESSISDGNTEDELNSGKLLHYEQVPQLLQSSLSSISPLSSSSSLPISTSLSSSTTLLLFDQLNQNDLFIASSSSSSASFSLENFIKKHDTISTYLEKINLDENDDYNNTTLR